MVSTALFDSMTWLDLQKLELDLSERMHRKR
jgi:hypothetical protein